KSGNWSVSASLQEIRSAGHPRLECAKDAVLYERSKHLRSLLVCALEGGDRGHVGASMSLIEIVGALYHDVARSTRPIRKHRGAIGSASAKDPRGSPQKGQSDPPSLRRIGIAAREAAPLIATWATL